MNTNQAFRGINPYKALLALGISPIPATEHSFIFEYGDEELILDSLGIHHPTFQGKFIAGSIVDFIARYFSWDYAKAIDYIIAHHAEALQEHLTFPPATIRDGTIADFKANRDRFESVMALRMQLIGNPFLGAARVWLQQRHIDAGSVANIVYAALGKQLTTLFSLQLCADEETELVDNVPYVVFPYFADPATPTAFQIVNTLTNCNQYLPMLPARHSFFGLHSVTSVDATTFLFRTPLAAAAAYSHSRGVGGSAINCAAVTFDVTAIGNPYKLRHATIMSEGPLDVAWVIRAKNLSTISKFWDDAGIAPTPALAPNADLALLEKFRQLLTAEKDMTPSVLAFIDSMRKDRQLFALLTSYLNQAGRQDLLLKIKAHQDASRVYHFKDMAITETSAGYVAEKNGNATTFTNFVIKVDENMQFGNCADIFHMSRLIFRDHEYPMIIPKAAITSTKDRDFESLARGAIMKAGYKETQILPIITDSTYRNMVYRAVRGQAEDASTIWGTAQLGWDYKNNKFVAPAWEASAFGLLDISERPFHPERQLLSRYITERQSWEVKPKLPRIVFNTPLCIIISYLVRGFLKAKTRAVLIKDLPANVRMLKTVLQCLGQSSAIPINPNIRNRQLQVKLDGFSGYPLFVTSQNEECFRELKYPLFCLGKEGISFGSVHTWDNVAPVAYQVISTTATALLQSDVSKLHLEEIPDKAEQDAVISQLTQEGLGFAKVLLSNRLCCYFSKSHQVLKTRILTPDSGVPAQV